MRTAVFAVLAVLCACTAAAAQIESVQPSTVAVGSSEEFLEIYGSDLGDRVIFSGKAGEFDLEISARSEKSVTVYLPDEIALTPDKYTNYVRGEQGTAGPAYFAVSDPAQQPLVLQVPDPMTAPATDRGGAVVDYEVWPLGGSDPRPYVKCSQPSGSLFPVGATTVDCTASNSNGEVTTSQVFVTVFDDTQPGDVLSLYMPEVVVGEASSAEGANVKFDVSAGGTRDERPEVKCDPDSGSLFRVGSTSVACFAKDAYGNTAQGQFDVSVYDPKDQPPPDEK
jgi:hypothetical protein